MGTAAESKKGKFPIWPEWNEADINAEKWDTGKTGKEKDKSGKSPVLVSCMCYFRFIYLF